MFLTQEERDKFASYLEQDAASNEQMAKQMTMLPAATSLAGLVRKYVTHAAAERLVAEQLRSVESTKI